MKKSEDCRLFLVVDCLEFFDLGNSLSPPEEVVEPVGKEGERVGDGGERNVGVYMAEVRSCCLWE